MTAMASDSPSSLQDFFARAAAQGKFVVRDAPKFDLDTYTSNYTGRTQIDRLMFIAHHSEFLAVEAVKLAIHKLRDPKSNDTHRYREAVKLLQTFSPGDSDAVLDAAWVDRTSREVADKSEKIEAELKSYKHNLIKESIRMAYEEQGRHYYSAGDLSSAFKAFTTERDYCTTPKHIQDMSLDIIRTAIMQGNWMTVQANVAKIRSLNRTPEEEEALRPKLNAIMGLSHLASGAFRDAARSFLDTPASLGSSYNEVLSGNDIAIYGTLCSLASMDRDELKREVLDNSEFRNYLELEPHLRRAVSSFYNAKYSESIKILEDYKNDYLLDLHLSKHVKDLYQAVRSKAIISYFVPFSVVTLSEMSVAFGVGEDELEKELVGMIVDGRLKARVDTKNKMVVAKETDPRSAVHRETIHMAQAYEKAARMKLVRMNAIRAGLEIKGVKGPDSYGGPFGPSGMGGLGGMGGHHGLRSGGGGGTMGGLSMQNIGQWFTR